MNFLIWIIFGALAGWIASMIMKTDAQQGAIANIVVGIVGAFIGGWLSEVILGKTVTGFNLLHLVIAVIGAVILLAVLRAFRGRAA